MSVRNNLSIYISLPESAVKLNEWDSKATFYVGELGNNRVSGV